MSIDDLLMVRKWRNDIDVKRYMNTQHEISEAEHLQWFNSASNDPKRRLLIYEENNVALGFVQFSVLEKKRDALWGFYLSPEAQRGTGYQLGKVALNYAFHTLDFSSVNGEVFAENERSIRFHIKLGFQRFEQKSSEQVSFALSKSRWIEINKGEMSG